MCCRYRSYKFATKLTSKGNSKAGATAQQIASNTTSVLVMQHKKCPCFEIFDKIFGETPNVKPVHPLEIGENDWKDKDDEEIEDDVAQPAPHVVAGTIGTPPRWPSRCWRYATGSRCLWCCEGSNNSSRHSWKGCSCVSSRPLEEGKKWISGRRT